MPSLCELFRQLDHHANFQSVLPTVWALELPSDLWCLNLEGAKRWRIGPILCNHCLCCRASTYSSSSWLCFNACEKSFSQLSHLSRIRYLYLTRAFSAFESSFHQLSHLNHLSYFSYFSYQNYLSSPSPYHLTDAVSACASYPASSIIMPISIPCFPLSGSSNSGRGEPMSVRPLVSQSRRGEQVKDRPSPLESLPVLTRFYPFPLRPPIPLLPDSAWAPQLLPASPLPHISHPNRAISACKTPERASPCRSDLCVSIRRGLRGEG